MSYKLKAYTRALKSYDKELFAGLTLHGVPCVFRMSKRFESAGELDGQPLLVLRDDKQYVCAITHNWSANGQIRDWGVDDVVGHVRAIDYWANERLAEELDEQNEKVDQAERRKLRNEMEGFWSYERRRFAKATDGILTHSLRKDEPHKKLRDRRIKNGNY